MATAVSKKTRLSKQRKEFVGGGIYLATQPKTFRTESSLIARRARIQRRIRPDSRPGRGQDESASVVEAESTSLALDNESGLNK